MSIQAYGSMMEQMGAARQRAFDKADTNGDGSLSLGEFKAALQAQQGGTNGSANPAATMASTVSDNQATALFTKLDVSGTGQLTMQELNQSRPHGGGHHGHHGQGGMGGLLGGNSLGALLGGQESAGDTTTEAGQTGLLASVEGAVKQAIGSYFGTQHS